MDFLEKLMSEVEMIEIPVKYQPCDIEMPQNEQFMGILNDPTLKKLWFIKMNIPNELRLLTKNLKPGTTRYDLMITNPQLTNAIDALRYKEKAITNLFWYGLRFQFDHFNDLEIGLYKDWKVAIEQR